jgi:hypothetical protein
MTDSTVIGATIALILFVSLICTLILWWAKGLKPRDYKRVEVRMDDPRVDCPSGFEIDLAKQPSPVARRGRIGATPKPLAVNHEGE